VTTEIEERDLMKIRTSAAALAKIQRAEEDQ
jgi:hypothetical protein